MVQNISFSCKKCFSQLSVPAEQIGQSLPCPSCGTVNIVGETPPPAQQTSETPKHTTAKQWYCFIGGKEIGPVPGNVLKQMASAGTLGPEDNVRREDQQQWYKAKQVNGMSFSQSETTPLQPPLRPTQVQPSEQTGQIIQFSCIHCGTTLKVSADKAGMKAKCNKCGAPIVIPTPKSAVLPLIPAETPQSMAENQESVIPPSSPLNRQEDSAPPSVQNQEASSLDEWREKRHQRKAKTARYKYIISLIVLALAIYYVETKFFGGTKSSSPTEIFDKSKYEPAKFGKILTDYADNQVRADKYWIGRKVYSTGTVESISGFSVDVFVPYKEQTAGPGILSCSISPEDKDFIASLHRSQTITAYGEVTLFGLSSESLPMISLKNCKFSN